MSYVPAPVRRLVRLRARNRCEYCLLPDDVSLYPHEVDHVVAAKHGGPTHESNLCLSCWVCNRYKGSDLASIDPQTGAVTPLFQPRQDLWSEHFRLAGAVIDGVTPRGRATVRLLRFNDAEQMELRGLLLSLGLYP